MAMAAWFFSWHNRCYGELMPKTITIKIIYEAPEGDDLAEQEIRETIEGLRNSLLSQVSGITTDIKIK